MSRSTWVDRVARAAAAVALAALMVGGVVALATLADEPLAPCTPTSTSVCTGPPADHSPNGDEYDSLPHCVTEDSDNCVWDARVDGNGEGRSFVTIDGVTHYLP
ncbi:hypothetical protein SEA_NAMAGO_106 [Microbacterium phage Namago]|nr:hypothetical protein SEA_NAMAGO_106 [Microbacterium phage Namago]